MFSLLIVVVFVSIYNHGVLFQPNGPLGGGGGFPGYNQVQGTGHQLPVPSSNYNTNTNNNNPSTVLSSMSSPPPHSMPAHNPNTVSTSLPHRHIALLYLVCGQNSLLQFYSSLSDLFS